MTNRGDAQTSNGRRLRPVEKMTRVADEGFTMNFGTSVLVSGEVDTDSLRRALDELVKRHPLLGSAVSDDRFAYGRAAPIPIAESNAPLEDADACIEADLQHSRWESEGPRARCVLVRHDASLATIALTFDHVTSDGSSGVIAMRDLLEHYADRTTSAAPIASPGQDAFFPDGRGRARDLLRALAKMREQGALPRPHRMGHRKPVVPEERRIRLRRIKLTRDETSTLVRRAKGADATVHGALVSALAIAIAESTKKEGDLPIRVMHPVDMRRYLASTSTGVTKTIGDAIGYYVSSVETDHLVGAETTFDSLASDVTRGVRSAKERGEPFLSAPSAGRLLVLARSLLGASRFRDTAERKLLQGTFALTNLGELERLGVRETYGPLRVLSFGFVASPSIFGPFCASASTFGGELELVIHHVEPRFDAATAARISRRVHALLRGEPHPDSP